MKRILPIALVGTALLAGLPLFGDQARRTAEPGAVNYVEGNVQLDGRQLNAQSVGNTAMNAGQVISTEQGKAEVLLTPGVFLRVGENSEVRMVSPDITPTQIEVDRGRAALEVDELHKENVLQVTTGGVDTRIAKTGFYEFDGDRPSLMVFKGEAQVDMGDNRFEKVKGGREVALVENAEMKPEKFDTGDRQDALYSGAACARSTSPKRTSRSPVSTPELPASRRAGIGVLTDTPSSASIRSSARSAGASTRPGMEASTAATMAAASTACLATTTARSATTTVTASTAAQSTTAR